MHFEGAMDDKDLFCHMGRTTIEFLSGLYVQYVSLNVDLYK